MNRRIVFDVDNKMLQEFKSACVTLGRSQEALITEQLTEFIAMHDQSIGATRLIVNSSVDIKPEMYNKLKQICDRKRIPVSQVVEQAVEKQVKRYSTSKIF